MGFLIKMNEACHSSHLNSCGLFIYYTFIFTYEILVENMIAEKIGLFLNSLRHIKSNKNAVK